MAHMANYRSDGVISEQIARAWKNELTQPALDLLGRLGPNAMEMECFRRLVEAIDKKLKQ